MNAHTLVTPNHLAKKAIIYIRQSTQNQVISNQESLSLQYNLKQKAIELGWAEQLIDTIDSDLGLSGSTTEHRNGFKEIVTEVTLGKVGIILSYDVTRLARNCSDWYPLLDVCGYKGCLIGDYDGVYDPGCSNGRLLLGLKGQLAEVELNTIRSRLNAGILNKAKRGDLALKLPVGLVRNIDGQVHKDPNIEVQERIDLVFNRFLHLGSASKVMQYLNTENLPLPRYDRFGDLVWKKPTVARVLSQLKNPAYAGAFVYGRTRSTRTGPSPIDKGQKSLPKEEWKIVVKDKYPSYITWEIFEKIQSILADNYAEYDRKKTRGIPRKGSALLHGIMYCGECGHKMVVQYKKLTRYICNYLRQQHGCKVCQYLPADAIDNEVVNQFFKALSPIELDAYEEALKKQKEENNELQKAKKMQLERLRYQAQLAERQFKKTDPDNRLVAAELEKRWEYALRELKAAEQNINTMKHSAVEAIPPELKNAFLQIGKKLPEIWNSELLSQQHRKLFLRCLISKVIAHRTSRNTLLVRIVWQGNETTSLEIEIPVGSLNELSNAKALTNAIIELAKSGKTDDEIATELTERGYRSPMDQNRVLPNTVKIIRLKHRIMVTRSQSHPRSIPGFLTVTQMAKLLEVTPHWLYDRLHNGTINLSKDADKGLYLFPDRPRVIKKLQALKAGNLKKLDFSRGHQDA